MRRDPKGHWHSELRFFSGPRNLHRYHVSRVGAGSLVHGLVNPERVTAFAVWFESGSKGEAIDRSLNRRQTS